MANAHLRSKIDIRPALTLLISASLMLGAGSAFAENGPGKKMPPPIVPIETVKTASVTIHQTFSGVTLAERQVDVRAQVSGILKTRAYVEGQKVDKGTPLFVIDDKPYVAALNEAIANQSSAEAALNAAHRNWNRIKTLYSKGVASVKERDDAQSALEMAQAAVKVAQAKKVAARINVDYTRINAPIAGIAGRRTVAVGNLVNVGDTLTQIEAIDPIQVILTTSADNPYADHPALKPGPDHPILATLLYGAEGTKRVDGKLNYRAVSIDPNTNSITLRGIFLNPDQALQPNEFVRVNVAVDKLDAALVIPQTALTSGIRPGSHAVYTVNSQNKITLTPVELGPMSDQGQVIKSGLSAGQRIVTDGLVKLRPDIVVEPYKAGKEKAGKE